MMTSSFRVENVEIEGFKAFTTPQSIKLSSRHLFVYGENGQGKTSILEAIRWCIWGGQADRRLRNTFYDGDCQVKLTLARSDGQWQLHREMRPESAESDYTLRDPSDERRKLESVFPHLPRISGEGMHLILAQQSAQRRAYVDIASFDEVLHAYLGILDDKKFLQRLIEMIEEFSELRDEIDNEAETLRDELNQQLSQTTDQLQDTLDRLSQEEPPTRQETLDRIKRKANELGFQDPLPLGTPTKAVQRLREHLDSKKQSGAEDDEKEHSHLRESRDRVKTLHEWLNTFKELTSVLDGRSLERLRNEVKELERQVETRDLLAKITKDSNAYLEETGIDKCPVCGETASNISETVSRRSSNISVDRDSLLEKHERINQRFVEANQLATELIDSDTTDDELAHQARSCEEELRLLLELGEEDEPTRKAIEDHLANLNSSIRSIDRQIEDREQWYEDHRRTIADLRNEVHCHDLRDRREEILHWLEDGFRPFQQRFSALTDALGALEDLREATCYALRTIIENRVDPLEIQMTQVYRKLTQQKSFDTLRLPVEGGNTLPELKLKVGTSDSPDTLWDYDDVLNGQALAALRLVPYFVFSALRQNETLPLEILMLDDPSQRFDTEHVGLLFEQLKPVAENAQLMVATHEEDRFNEFVADHFLDEASSVVVRVVDFDRDRGPTLDVSQ